MSMPLSATVRKPKSRKSIVLPVMAVFPVMHSVDINAMDKDSMVTFCKTNGIDFAVVAPDDPLAAGRCNGRSRNSGIWSNSKRCCD
ncbi:MAG: hypothetical protein ACLSCV_06595 [Acutalibacteraceae bacterium]